LPRIRLNRNRLHSNYRAIQVIDDPTGRGGPVVSLRAISKAGWRTDSNGNVAFDQPGLMNLEVFSPISKNPCVQDGRTGLLASMVATILFWFIAFTARAVILTALLWIMVKIQRLQYSFPGLLGSAALASGLDMIPLVGHYLAVPVLYVCIWKVTRADLFPDAVFTVAVSYALMFGVQLFFLGALLGDLRPSARSVHLNQNVAGEIASEDSPAGPTNAAPAADQKRHAPATAKTSSTNTQRMLAAATNSVKPGPSRPERIASQLTFKGLTRNARQSTLVLDTGVKTYTLVYGEPELVQTRLGAVPVRLEALGDDYVVLNVDGEAIRLSLR
jgi:hypothetical protein